MTKRKTKKSKRRPTTAEDMERAVYTHDEVKTLIGQDAEPNEVGNLLGMSKISGPGDSVLTELTLQQSLNLALMQAGNTNTDPDCSFNDPLIDGFIYEVKVNLKSFKRQGLKELVAVMERKAEEQMGLLARVQNR